VFVFLDRVDSTAWPRLSEAYEVAALPSLVGITFGVSVVVFEPPGERMVTFGSTRLVSSTGSNADSWTSGAAMES
jgi:hypothetical protein